MDNGWIWKTSLCQSTLFWRRGSALRRPVRPVRVCESGPYRTQLCPVAGSRSCDGSPSPFRNNINITRILRLEMDTAGVMLESPASPNLWPFVWSRFKCSSARGLCLFEMLYGLLISLRLRIRLMAGSRSCDASMLPFGNHISITRHSSFEMDTAGVMLESLASSPNP
jgi:hypothetical protein